MPSTLNTVKNVQSVYRTPLIEVSTKCVFTNTSHVSAYRGAGRPEGNYYMERLIDAAAAEMGIDRLELRRRNQIKPRELPLKVASGSNYDSGDFPGVLKHALEVADAKGFARPQAREPQARQGARARHRQLSRSDRAAVEGDGRHPLRGRRHRHHHHRHARLRPGPCRAVRAGADREARHSLRAHPAAAGRQRRAARRRRHRRLEIDHAQRHRDRGSVGKGDRAGQADRLARAGSLGVRHRVRARALRHRRHRPRDRDHGARGQAALGHQAAGRRADDARRATRQRRARRLHLSQRLPCLRGRARSRYRRDRGGEIFLGQRFRHRHQPADRRGPAARRRDPGHRPGADGNDRLRRRRPVPDRLVHGLCAAARERLARGRRGQSPGAGEDQRARRQRLRRGRLRRLADLGDERGRRCAVRIRHPAHRHAGDALSGLARHPGRAARRSRRDRRAARLA